MSHQSRKHARAVVQLVARYRSPTVFNFVEEECYDLSTGGMFISSLKPAPPGTLLKLECDEAGGSGQVKAIARVVWLREEANQDGPQGMGVKFVKIDADGQAVVDRVIEGRASMLPAGERFRGSSLPPARRQELASMPADEVDGAIADEISRSQAPAAPPEPVAESSPTDPPASDLPTDTQSPATAHEAKPDEAKPDEAKSDEAKSDESGQEPLPVARTTAENSSTPEASSTTDVSAPVEAQTHESPNGESESEPDALHADDHGSPASSNSTGEDAPETLSIGTKRDSDKSGLMMGIGAAAVLGLAVLFQGYSSSTPSTKTHSTSTHKESASASTKATTGKATTGKANAGPDSRATGGTDPASKSPPSPRSDVRGVKKEDADDSKTGVVDLQPHTTGAEADVEGVSEDAPDEAASKPYVLNVVVRPKTAKLTVPGGTEIKSGEYRFASFGEPIRIRAEKAGYRPTAATVKPVDFKADGNLMRRQIFLKLRKSK